MRMSSMRGRMPGILGSTALAVVLAAGRTGALGPLGSEADLLALGRLVEAAVATR